MVFDTTLLRNVCDRLSLLKLFFTIKNIIFGNGYMPCKNIIFINDIHIFNNIKVMFV